MSSTELNKGRMIPVEESVEDVAEKCITDLGEYFDTKLEEFKADHYEFGYEFLNGKLYKMEFDVEADTTLDFAEAAEDEDGVIEFLTIHYNGGASLMEVIESALEQRRKRSIKIIEDALKKRNAK